jgi:hypothetical protein
MTGLGHGGTFRPDDFPAFDTSVSEAPHKPASVQSWGEIWHSFCGAGAQGLYVGSYQSKVEKKDLSVQFGRDDSGHLLLSALWV